MDRSPVPPRSHHRRRGVVIIFSIAILALMAILASTFATMSRMERNVSRNFVDLARARMLASSGIELAVSRLSREALDPATMTAHHFYGEDLNANGRSDAGEDVNANGWEETRCPLYRAPHPSYMADLDGNGVRNSSDLLRVEGVDVGVSGVVAGTYAGNGDFFSVKVTDLSAKFNVNMDGHPHLRTILQNLAEAAGLSRSVGDSIFANRPYGSMIEVRDRCGLTTTQFEAIKDLITVYGWFDTKVVNAVPLSRRRRPGLGTGRYVYTWEDVRPNRIDFPRNAAGTVVGRCPVNVNLAPREVLIALVRDLRGFYLDEESFSSSVNSGYSLMNVRYTYSGSSGSIGQIRQTSAISLGQAQRVANAMLAHRLATPFRTWQDFNDFLWNDLFRAGVLDRRQIDVLKANFNPNSNINDFNPEYFRFAWVDKSDLDFWTTELTFTPTGYYGIESIGRVLNAAREVVAEAELLVDTKLFDLYRETTQKDFLTEFWRDGAPLGSVISRERGPGKTSGGMALTSFPEMPDPTRLRDADYDGHLTLATKQTLGGGASFQASFFDRALEADSGHRLVPDVNGPYSDRLLDQTGGSGTSRAGKLFPDGVYCELDSVPMYNYQPRKTDDFSVSLWIKPHFFPEHAGRTRVFLTWQKMGGSWWNRVYPLGVYCTVTSYVEDKSVGGYEYQEPWDTPAILAGGTVDRYQGACASPCVNHLEHGHPFISRGGENWGTMFEAGKWMHVGWVHDGTRFRGRPYSYPGTKHEDLDIIYVNGRKVSGVFSYQTGDVSSPADYAGEILRLGERRSAGALNTVPDATLDEVLVWDGASMPRAEQQILDEYGDGRFYNGDDGTFTSQSIDLAATAGIAPGTPVRIGMVSWTRYLPTSLPRARITLDLLRASDASTLAGTGVLARPEGERVMVATAEPIRYRVHIEAGAGGLAPIVDTPVFDDITITFSRGPRMMSWAWVCRR